MYQPDLFSQPQATTAVKSGYSETSRMAYNDVTPGRLSNEEKIYAVIQRLKATCLKEIADLTGIEQGTVSARVNTLIEKGKVIYADKENYISYKNRIRKKICLCS